ncbi:SsrA-binding protein SmpB [bacterium]|nr:SsrA-binding protein SmpB [bacterium]
MTIIENKKAYFNYQILEKFKAGIVLQGQEVKSIKSGKISLRGSFVVLRGEEVFLIGANIPPYQPKNAPKNYNPQRSRKLLLKKTEIRHLIGKAKQRGLTMVPLKVYTDKGKIKLEFGIARGKKKVDKRELIKKREIEREIKRALKGGVRT